MNLIWGKILIGCVIGVIIGALAGLVTGMAGLPGWLPGAITGAAVPLIYVAIQSRERNERRSPGGSAGAAFDRFAAG